MGPVPGAEFVVARDLSACADAGHLCRTTAECPTFVGALLAAGLPAK